MKVLNANSDRNGKIAATIYIIVCLFFLFALKCESPDEDYSNEGVIVNLGFTDNGQSDNTPEAENQEIQEEATPEEVVEEVVEAEVVEESVTQDNVEVNVTAQDKVNEVKTPVVKTPEVVKEKVPEVVKEPEKVVEEQADPNALFNGPSNNSNQGTGNQNGDQGNPNGSLESNIYGDITGPGLGETGQGYGLNGRSLGSKPAPVSEKQEYGIVAIKIKVNQQGKVISASFSNSGSTTTDTYLVNLSIKEAYKVTFNPDSKAPSTQTGWVSFHYKPN